MKVVTRVVGKVSWVLCFEGASKKNAYLDLLRAIKIDEQHQDGLIFLKNKLPTPSLANLLNPKKDHPLAGPGYAEGRASFNATTQKVTDGYWVTLQSWTQCSLKCGGGTSTLQRMCVPPKAGGKECEGEAIITKPCNTIPCASTFGTTQELVNSDKVTIRNPIMKSLPFSDNPQRYVKCKIKESDLFVFLNVTDKMFDQQNIFKRIDMRDQKTVQFPVRAIMNNQTISLYTGDELVSMFLAFQLKETKFYRDRKPGCFQLYQSINKYITLCPFGCENGDTKDLEEWDYDFHLFKNQCNVKRDNYDRELKNKLDQKIVNF
jgi:hypothetical protein